MSEYQNRVDIDKIFDDFYDYTGKTRAVVFLEKSPYNNISSETDSEKNNSGTIDALMKYYRLDDVADKLDEFMTSVYDVVYPIGTLYHTTNNSFNPNISFGGVWNKISEDNNIYIWERISETE